MHIAWGRVVRDSIIVFVVSFLGGFVVGFIGVISGLPIVIALDVLDPLVTIAAFVYVSMHAPTERWQHLIAVAFGAWLIGIIEVIFGLMAAYAWVSSLAIELLLMAIGGGLGAMLASRKSSAV